MDTILTNPPAPLSLSSYPLPKLETRFSVHCDRLFFAVSVQDPAGTPFLTVSNPGIKSWSFRRTVKDSSENPLIDLRRHSNNINWVVETPGTGEHVAEVKHALSVFSGPRSALDVVLKTRAKAGDGEGKTEGERESEGREVIVKVRPVDRSAITTLVSVGEGEAEVVVAEIKLTGSNDVAKLNGADRSTWEARVAGGVDIVLVLVILLCRAEIHHKGRD